MEGNANPSGYIQASMQTDPLSSADETLIEQVEATNAESVDGDFLDGAHIVAVGIRLDDGTIYEGVSLPAKIGRASVCAEPVAVGSAIADGHSHGAIETSVAVAYPMSHHETSDQRIIPPCGVCRELLVDYNPDMRIIVPGDTEPEVVRTEDLLPIRTW